MGLTAEGPLFPPGPPAVVPFLYPFIGQMCNIAIYNTALTQDTLRHHATVAFFVNSPSSEGQRPMPSAQDIFNKLVELGDKLDTLNATPQSIKTDDDQLLSVVSTDLGEVIAADTYTNQALYQNALQNATIICLLEQISKNTCDLVNLATVQTRLQESIEKNTMRMAAMLSATPRRLRLRWSGRSRRDLERCCPPEPMPPACKQKPCQAPKQIDPPPQGNVIQ